MFSKISPSKTNIHFENTIEETATFNIMVYEYMYNGGGVAIGDINNDGYTDLYFSGNQVENKLYLNEGNFQFRDITQGSGTAGKNTWATGVNMADVNGDGWLDIYLCHSGEGTDAEKSNELFINNHDLTFTEKAKEYGIDAPGTYSTQSCFFDLDNDGDLDMFLLNHAANFFNPYYNTSKLRSTRNATYGNRLYKNDNGRFIDISEDAGILSSALNFGLGVSASDLNHDGYTDIYVTNDYDEQDFMYLNNGNATFKEVLKESVAHISKYSMGSDISDFNNDVMADIVTLDMLPEDHARQKKLKGADNYDQYQMSVQTGYHHQVMRNMLQVNQGVNEKGTPMYSEIGRLAGISATDWSWCPLFADFDNDGWKDLFITNGYLRDFTNLDFLKYTADAAFEKVRGEGKDISTKENYAKHLPLIELINKMPSAKISNFIFSNNKDLTFSNKTNEWGLHDPAISNGAAYADLDNDGDLDIVTNNINTKASIYRNNTEELGEHHYLRVKLSGDKGNLFGIGAKVLLHIGKARQYQELFPVRGFQSSSDYTLVFGLGDNTMVDTLKVFWPDGKISVVNQVEADTTLVITNRSAEMKSYGVNTKSLTPLFELDPLHGVDYIHKENDFVDFKSERLIPKQYSRLGPKISTGDVNKDGLEDFFVGGAAGQAGSLFLQTRKGNFIATTQTQLIKDKDFEDVGSAMFDADNDGDVDLYVVSGGNEFPYFSPMLQDRLYINDGSGNYTAAHGNSLPRENNAGSCVVASDYDHDGDVDLFVGSSNVPGNYGVMPGNMFLINQFREKGKLGFIDGARGMSFLKGMTTDAVWVDLNKDSWQDLVIAGEWQPLTVYLNKSGKLEKDTSLFKNTNGAWQKIIAHDFDKDGDMDLVAGNVGKNTLYAPSQTNPLVLYVSDFDEDGRIDPIICFTKDNKEFPLATRDELLEQITQLRKKFIKYEDYASADITTIFTPDQLTKAKKYTITNYESLYFENVGNNSFKTRSLPNEAQFSTIQSFIAKDFNEDGHSDLFLAGNYYHNKVDNGPADAARGLLLLGSKEDSFTPLPHSALGVDVGGDVRDMTQISTGNKDERLIVTRNNGPVQVIKKVP